MHSLSSPQRMRWVTETAILAAVYYTAGRLGQLLAVPPGNVTAVWPPSGIALAAVLLLGTRAWVGIWLGAFFANTWAFYDGTSLPATAGTVAAGCSIASGSTLQALLGAWLLVQWLVKPEPLARAQDVFKFAVVAVVMCLVSSTFGVTTLCLSGFCCWSSYGSTWLTWWLGDAVGVLVVTPLLLSWARKPREPIAHPRSREAVLLFLLLAATALIVFGGLLHPEMTGVPLGFILFPVFIWAAFRLSQRKLSTALMLVSAIAIWGTVRGYGPFIGDSPDVSLLLLQAFVGVLSITSLGTSAVVAERREAERALRLTQFTVDTVPESIFWIGPDARFVKVNDTACRVLGYTREELLTLGVADVDPAFPMETWPAHWQEIQTRGSFTFETSHRTKNGRVFPVEVNVNYLRYGDAEYNCALARDITERKQTEQAMKMERDFVSAVLETVGALVVVLDSAGRILSFNRCCEMTTGFTRDEVVGKHLWDILLVEEEIEAVRSVFRSLTAGQFPNQYENFWLTKDGGRRLIAWSNTCLVDRTKAVEYVIATGIDITDRRKAEEALQKEQELVKAVMENLSAGVVACDAHGTLTLFNRAIREFHGLPERPLPPEEWAEYYDLYLPDGKTPMEKEDIPLFRAWQGEYVQNQEMMIIPKDGTPHSLLASGRPLFNSKGHKLGAVVVMHDITERKAAEEALRRDESRSEALVRLGQMHHATPKALMDSALEEAVRLTRSEVGYLACMNEDETELTMHSWSKTAMAQCAIDDKPTVYPVVTTGLWGEAVRQRKPIITNDYSAPNPLKKGVPEGHVAIRRHLNVPIFDGNRIVAVVGVGNKDQPYDESDVRQLDLLMTGVWRILQKKQTDEELRQYREELENLVAARTSELQSANDKLQQEVAWRRRMEAMLAKQARDLARSNAELEQFAYIASHDLQEPLRKIQAFGDRLKTRCGEVVHLEAREYLDRMQKAAFRMQTLINDLLSYSRVTTQAHPFVLVDLNDIAREVVSDLEAAVERTGARVEVGSLPCIHADPLQMRQLLQNLLSNALKFHKESCPPEVRVSAEKEGGFCRLTVEDNGIGFDEKYLDRIFTIFQRLHGRDEYEGTGVGLAICKKIVERHGGTITATSRPDEGATFVVSLPLKSSEGRGR